MVDFAQTVQNENIRIEVREGEGGTNALEAKESSVRSAQVKTASLFPPHRLPAGHSKTWHASQRLPGLRRAHVLSSRACGSRVVFLFVCLCVWACGSAPPSKDT